MAHHFYAYLSRMKHIRRWSLMRNVQPENIQEHSHQVAVVAHALCEIDRIYFGGSADPAKTALLAMYHDVGEVIIGDLPTPVKYFNPEIKTAYGAIEDVAKEKLLSMLPEELTPVYRPLFFAEKEKDAAEQRFVKAADKLCAYLKCIEEVTAGNREFVKAKESIEAELQSYVDMPAVQWFLEHCADGFARTLDELD